MTWFKVDDGLPEHRKVRRLGRDRAPAMGVWVLCGAWASNNLTDGFVPDEVVQRYDPRSKYSARLVEVGLWLRDEEDGEGGYRFHDWADIQPTRADVETRREEVRKRVQKHRQGKSGSVQPPDNDPHGGAQSPGAHGSSNALLLDRGNTNGNALQETTVTESYSQARTAAGARPVPSRPVPTTKTTTPLASQPELPPTTQTLVGEWIDQCRRRPPGTVIGQTSKVIKGLLEEGLDPDDIRNGITLWTQKGLHPSALPSAVNECMNATAKHVRTHRTTDDKVSEWQQLKAESTGAIIYELPTGEAS